MALDLIGLKLRTLRSEHDTTQRQRAIAEFNDPESDVDVVVSSMLVTAMGLNMHGAWGMLQGHDSLVAVLSPPPRTYDRLAGPRWPVQGGIVEDSDYGQHLLSSHRDVNVHQARQGAGEPVFSAGHVAREATLPGHFKFSVGLAGKF